MKKQKYIIGLFSVLAFGLMLILTNKILDARYKKDVLGTSTTVTAQVTMDELTFKVYPEKRIPSTNNWDTFVDITLQNCNSSETYSFSDIETSPSGLGTIPVSNISADDYRLYITGHSHLRREFNCYPIYYSNTHLDLTTENKYLLAGEISPTNDNYITHADVDVLVQELFTNDYTADLNQDGIVNALDLSIQVTNLFKKGD